MKIYKNILIIVIVLAVLTGVLVYVNNIPENNTEEPPQIQEKTEYIDVLKLDQNNIISINVKTPEDNYTVTKNNDGLSLSNSSNLKINPNALRTLYNSYSYIYAEKLVTEKAEDAHMYGFDSPKTTVTVTLNDNSKKIIHIGNDAIDGMGSYLKIDGENKIYLRSSYGINSLAPKYDSFIDLNVLDVKPTEYQEFSHVNIEKAGNKGIEIKAYKNGTGENMSISWKMTKPAFADANGVILSNRILTPLESFTADGVIEAHASDLGRYGLNTPYAKFSIGTDNNSQNFVFGKETEGYRFFMLDSYDTVYIASVDKTSFLDIAYIDLMSRLVHTENIKNISKVEIKTSDKNYTLKISGEERFINGKKIDKNAFAKVYENVISISFNSVDTAISSSSKPDVTIKYTRNDGTKCTVSFIPVSARNYLALVDGKGNSIVNKSSVLDVIDFIEKTYNEAK